MNATIVHRGMLVAYALLGAWYVLIIKREERRDELRQRRLELLHKLDAASSLPPNAATGTKPQRQAVFDMWHDNVEEVYMELDSIEHEIDNMSLLP